MIIEAGAASVITVTARSPFGETERSARRWLPYRRLLAAIALTGLAILALQLGAVGENLNDGIAVLAWNVIGFTGLGLPCSLITVARSPGRSPRDNTTFCQYALLEAWTAPVDLAGRSARRSRRLDLRLHGLRGRPAAVHHPGSPRPHQRRQLGRNPLSCTAGLALGLGRSWPAGRAHRSPLTPQGRGRSCL